MENQTLPKKILVVDDDRDFQEFFAEKLLRIVSAEKILILVAMNLQEARRLFAENPDIDLIIMDACMQSRWPNTERIIKEFRVTFTGPMVAGSSSKVFREQLMGWGCSHNVERILYLPEKVIEILEL